MSMRSASGAEGEMMAESSSTDNLPGAHMYDGLLLPPLIPPATLDAVQKLQFYHEDLLILGYPKSGINWLAEMAWLVTHDANTEKAQANYQEDRVTYLECHYSIQDDPEVFRMSKSPPRIMKSHLPARFLENQLKDGDTKVIIIIRDLKDTLVSYFNFRKANQKISHNGSWDAFFELFKQKKMMYGDWGNFYKSWWVHRENPNFLFLRYEDLRMNPSIVVEMIAKHCNKTLTEEQVERIVKYTSFSEMKNNPRIIHPRIKNYFRKGAIGDWVNYFSGEQLQYMAEYHKELEGLAIPFSDNNAIV